VPFLCKVPAGIKKHAEGEGRHFVSVQDDQETIADQYLVKVYPTVLFFEMGPFQKDWMEYWASGWTKNNWQNSLICVAVIRKQSAVAVYKKLKEVTVWQSPKMHKNREEKTTENSKREENRQSRKRKKAEKGRYDDTIPRAGLGKLDSDISGKAAL